MTIGLLLLRCATLGAVQTLHAHHRGKAFLSDPFFGVLQTSVHIGLHESVSVKAPIVTRGLLPVDRVADALKLSRRFQFEWHLRGFQWLRSSEFELLFGLKLVL